MATNNRITRQNITGIISNGSGSARIDATIAEQKAEEALQKAKEALAALRAANIDVAISISDDLKEVKQALADEIGRSMRKDDQHDELIQPLTEAEQATLWDDPASKK
jgi:hypothetical protein